MSIIFIGVWNRKDEVAIKQLKPYNMSPEAFLEEAEIMKQLQHENIIILYGVVSIFCAVVTDC